MRPKGYDPRHEQKNFGFKTLFKTKYLRNAETLTRSLFVVSHGSIRRSSKQYVLFIN